MKPAWYTLEPGGWRDYVSLLHLPYTAWHLAYVVIGGCLAASVAWDRLLLTVLAFALALGIGAHTLDELQGRPLRTAIPDRVLIVLAVLSIGAACAIGVAVAIRVDPWLLAFVACGAFLVVAYNLELAGGRFHSDLWFGISWGAFPVLTGAYASTGRLDIVAALGALWALLLSLAQRTLSTPVRRVRRQVTSVEGRLELGDGTSEPLQREHLTSPAERSLLLLAAATVTIAAALAALRLTA